MESPRKVAIVGAGKIARDQHIPAIARSEAFELAAIVDPNPPALGVPGFATLQNFLREGPSVDAVAICTPPQVRVEIALEAVAAGLHVLLEKPPAATVAAAETLKAAATDGQVLFAAWHSRFAPMVADAKSWLASRTILGGRVVWREDAHQWHPGQRWLWRPGGLGVFDAAINAFSILTEIAAAPWQCVSADLQIPSGLHAPVSAQLELRVGKSPVSADLHFNDCETPEWTILLETDDGSLQLCDGGAGRLVDGEVIRGNSGAEYACVYRRFAELIAAGRSDVDVSPLGLVADAFLIARNSIAPPFEP